METSGVQLNQIPKMIKVISHRTGRYYYRPIDEASVNSMPVISGRSAGDGGDLQYPMVWASVAAGVIGVILVVVIILSIWIRTRCCSPSKSLNQHPSFKAVYAPSTSDSMETVCSSSSSLRQGPGPQAAAAAAAASALAELHIISEV